jgi:G:T-mismatch repair DNA endonuclease (very short patch repair protein)
VLTVLDELNIGYECETNRHFKAFNPIMERRFCPRVDVFIPSKMLVIEVFGVYWHADPRKYKCTDLFYTVYGPLTSEQIWSRDKIKIDHIKALGFNVEIIWESDISSEYIKNVILKYENSKN